MRLFTAIDIPDATRAALQDLLRDLRPAAALKWSPPSNLHITTKFIGEWPEERLGEIQEALRQIPQPSPIEIGIRGVGWFPNPHSPRVLFAAIQAGPDLPALAKATNDALEAIGIPLEEKPFSPHLTLARIKEPVPLGPLRQKIAARESLDFGTFSAASFHLYVSETRPGGSVYTKLAEFPLIRA